MRRRGFLALLGAGVLPGVAHAQLTGRTYRLGILSPTPIPSEAERSTATILIPKALTELGYAPGRDLVVDVRYADGWSACPASPMTWSGSGRTSSSRSPRGPSAPPGRRPA